MTSDNLCDLTILAMFLGRSGRSGTGCPTKTDEFSEKFQRGGGVISNPKIYIADFGPLNRAFLENDTKRSFQDMFFNNFRLDIFGRRRTQMK